MIQDCFKVHPSVTHRAPPLQAAKMLKSMAIWWPFYLWSCPTKQGFNHKVPPKIKRFAQDLAKIWWILGNPQGLPPFWWWCNLAFQRSRDDALLGEFPPPPFKGVDQQAVDEKEKKRRTIRWLVMNGANWWLATPDFLYVYLDPQMTFVLIGKDLVLEGSTWRINRFQVSSGC